jgi:hypothetical protein
MVSGAVYDAVNAIAGEPYEPYLSAPRTTGRESVDAAVATAAYRILVSLLPAQADRLRAQYDDFLAGIPAGRRKDGGIAVGRQTAAAMIAARANDGSYNGAVWTIGAQPGQWRPAPPTNGADGAWIAFAKPFAVPNAEMFRTAGPHPLTSAAYARDVTEVQRIGARDSTVRTADQTEAAIWWHDRKQTEWEIKRQLAETQHLTVPQTARMFAMVDFTSADTQIACFNDKYAWSFWRPITAIRQADTDGNPGTTADPTWTPLLVTPPFPDHPSGHACGTAARMQTLRVYFGRDRVPFHAYSAVSGTTRYFTSFSQAADELIEARVWGGIHFRTADVQGAELGEQVSRYVTRHFFQPLRRR